MSDSTLPPLTEAQQREVELGIEQCRAGQTSPVPPQFCSLTPPDAEQIAREAAGAIVSQNGSLRLGLGCRPICCHQPAHGLIQFVLVL